MPTVNLNKKEFEKLVGKKLSLEKLKDRISMLGTDLEEIKGNEIIVEIFPDRPDMLSEQGFARAFSSFIGVKKGLRNYKAKKSDYKLVVESSVKDVRPYTACAVVKNLKFDNEKIKQIIQIQEKLHISYGRNRKKCAIGIYPFEKIKFPIHYKALEPEKINFIPLESSKEMNGNEILKKHPAGKEYGSLLNGKEKFPVFIDANNNILSMPPIINSDDTGRITKKTKEIFIEVSGFDYNIVSKCLNIIVCALSDMKGIIYEIKLEYGNKRIISPNLKSESMKININYANNILGLKLNEGDVKNYLERMGYGYNKGKVMIPCYRADIMHQVDLIEDIAIAYGYENFKEEIPNVSTIGSEDEFEKFKRKAKDVLIGFGYLECNSYNLISKEVIVKTGYKGNTLSVSNPVNADYNTIRNGIIPSLMKILNENKHNEYPQKIFEIGTVFEKEESENLGLLSCHTNANFTEIKQILDYLFNSLGLKYNLEEAEHDAFINGRAGRIIAKGKNIGMIGEINPQVLEKFNLDTPAAGFELNLKELIKESI
jgi:phenylalanyl-tRNA synthetase beta chain